MAEENQPAKQQPPNQQPEPKPETVSLSKGEHEALLASQAIAEKVVAHASEYGYSDPLDFYTDLHESATSPKRPLRENEGQPPVDQPKEPVPATGKEDLTRMTENLNNTQQLAIRASLEAQYTGFRTSLNEEEKKSIPSRADIDKYLFSPKGNVFVQQLMSQGGYDNVYKAAVDLMNVGDLKKKAVQEGLEAGKAFHQAAASANLGTGSAPPVADSPKKLTSEEIIADSVCPDTVTT